MRKPEPESVPVSIPHVVLDVHEDGTLTATLDGAPFSPPEGAPAWLRSSFPEIVDLASRNRVIPVRVEVREADGAVFTDFIPSRPHRTSENTPQAAPKRAAVPVFHTVEGPGFVPGEDVAVAIITGHTDAAHTGIARALIDPTHLSAENAGGGVEVLLFGRVSGTTIVRRVP